MTIPLRARRASRLLLDHALLLHNVSTLARELGVGRRQVHRWKAGTSPVPPGRIARLEELAGYMTYAKAVELVTLTCYPAIDALQDHLVAYTERTLDARNAAK